MGRLVKTWCAVMAGAVAVAMPMSAGAQAQGQRDVTIRVKDLGKFQGWRDNSLIGYGIVSGLAGTGDSPTNRATRQAMANVLAQFNLTLTPEQMQSRNVAVVMVTAQIPAFAREGDVLDATVSSTGDARSLVGGSLLVTALKAPNGRVYALAQGPLAVGGYRYDANGNVVVEVGMNGQVLAAGRSLTFVLAEPDYTTASRIAAAINTQLGAGTAQARDAGGIDIDVPDAARSQLVSFVARIESVGVEPDRRSKVVVNERTGTVVSGGDVRIAKVAIAHGDLKVSITSLTQISQPFVMGSGSAGVRTAAVTNAQVSVSEEGGPGFLAGGTTVSDLVQSLARLKTSTRDVISILRAIKAAGALHAELIIQ